MTGRRGAAWPRTRRSWSTRPARSRGRTAGRAPRGTGRSVPGTPAAGSAAQSPPSSRASTAPHPLKYQHDQVHYYFLHY